MESYCAKACNELGPIVAESILPIPAVSPSRLILAFMAMLPSAGVMARFTNVLLKVPKMVSISASMQSALISTIRFILSTSSIRPATEAFRPSPSTDALMVVESTIVSCRSVAWTATSAV